MCLVVDPIDVFIYVKLLFVWLLRIGYFTAIAHVGALDLDLEI